MKSTITTTALKFLLLLGSLSAPGHAQNKESSNENWLNVKPGQCVALHQGQLCYQTLDFTWQVSSAEEYCLVQERMGQPVVCWRGGERSSHQLEFNNTQQTRFDLQMKSSGRTVANVMVDVAWVYKQQKRRSGWRLF